VRIKGIFKIESRSVFDCQTYILILTVLLKITFSSLRQTVTIRRKELCVSNIC